MPGAVHAGVALLLLDNKGDIVMLKRTGSHGKGLWATPGGWVDAWEHPLDTVKREAFEELGIVLTHAEFFTFTKDEYPDEDVEAVCLWFWADNVNYTGTPKIMEPHKATDLKHMSVLELVHMPKDEMFGNTQAALDIWLDDASMWA